jgi:hypothetical protein
MCLQLLHHRTHPGPAIVQVSASHERVPISLSSALPLFPAASTIDRVAPRVTVLPAPRALPDTTHGREYSMPSGLTRIPLHGQRLTPREIQGPYTQVVLFGDSLLQGASQVQDGFSFQGALQHRKITPPLTHKPSASDMELFLQSA